MKVIQITTIQSEKVLQQLAKHLDGKIDQTWGETFFEFNNSFGKGVIRSIEFDWGVSLMDYDVNFKEDVKIIFKTMETKPVEFIFVSEGSLKYYSGDDQKEHKFERFQNIIISNKKNAKETYIFPGQVTVKVNFININKKEYRSKKNNNLTYLNKKLLHTFEDNKGSTVYNHFGNFSLKIADQVKQLQDTYESGIVRTLSVEGQLNLIMAMQILEHSNFEDSSGIPESISKEEIKKIHELSAFIVDNISENLTVKTLSAQSGLSPKKLQQGFRVLHSKSVNEYVRQLKLEISRDYIDNSNDTISEIVYRVGFKSRSYFSKIFYEYYGILPVDYRKLVRGKNKKP